MNLFCEKRRWSQGLQDWSTGAPPEHQAAQLCCAGDRAVAQAAQSLWALLLGDLQTPAGRGLGTLLWVSLLEPGLGRMDPEGPSYLKWFMHVFRTRIIKSLNAP